MDGFRVYQALTPVRFKTLTVMTSCTSGQVQMTRGKRKMMAGEASL
jgi:hypothetical protein